jgi:hypothetical protein
MLKIPVTQDHIDQGKPGSSTACAVALAIQSDQPALQLHWVGQTVIQFDQPDIKLYTSLTLCEWIGLFDHRSIVQPFTLILDLENQHAGMQEEEPRP